MKLLPFRRAIRIGTLKVRRGRECSKELAEWIATTVDELAERVPWKAVCIHRGIAVQSMLRRRGVDAILHYGAAFSAGRNLEAHVWVVVDGRAVIGGEQAPNFKLLSTFP